MGIEREYEIVQQKMPFLRNVSRYDETYSKLIAGELAPVFADADSPVSLAETIHHPDTLYQTAA